jgi:sugar phosphate isomerase/epimerase
MKLSIMSYLIAKDWDLPTYLEVARRCGCEGVEFRVELGHKHGVELERTARERRAILRKCTKAAVAVACVATGCRFHFPEAEKRTEQVALAKQYVQLAADLGSPRIRVFGNDLPPEVERRRVVGFVGNALREIAEFADPLGVDVLLEMHGDFNDWRAATLAVKWANHPRAGIVYNCDQRDIVDGSVRQCFEAVRHLLRHVHYHSLLVDYPYKELLGLLRGMGYQGYLSAELPASTDPETVMGLTAALMREYIQSLG